LHELARAIEWIDNPDARFVQASEVVHGLFREPTFTRAEQCLAQNFVDGAVGLSDGIVSDLVFSFNSARSEAVEHGPRRFQGGVNAFQQFLRIGRKRH